MSKYYSPTSHSRRRGNGAEDRFTRREVPQSQSNRTVGRSQQRYGADEIFNSPVSDQRTTITTRNQVRPQPQRRQETYRRQETRRRQEPPQSRRQEYVQREEVIYEPPNIQIYMPDPYGAPSVQGHVSPSSRPYAYGPPIYEDESGALSGVPQSWEEIVMELFWVGVEGMTLGLASEVAHFFRHRRLGYKYPKKKSNFYR